MNVRREFSPVVTLPMRRLLLVVLALVSILIVNSAYLAGVSLVQWWTEKPLENSFYQSMFLVHLVLGLGIVVPTLVFIGLHLRRAIGRPNRTAVALGIATFGAVLVLLISGIVLTRGLFPVEIREPLTRQVVYWIHVIAPVAAIWLFVLHRMVGPKIRWRSGAVVAVVSVLACLVGVHFLMPKQSNKNSSVDFSPALAMTSTGGYLLAEDLMMDEYCASCHPDVHAQWAVSAHRFASFNNPAYAFAVNNTRAKILARDGNLDASRFCAGCHDPVLLFSGAFDNPKLDVINDPRAHAGITCISCHSIVDIPSNRGNASFIIESPEHYPFARSNNSFLRWVNEILIKGKPSFHKRTFLKPIHQTAEFCGACHKVHLPQELNNYKWLRGQNHYDSYLLSGVSGHGVASFYFPDKAEHSCNGCHMKVRASRDFGAKMYEEIGQLGVKDHQFPAANTALQYMVDVPREAMAAHEAMLRDALRVDIFAFREGDRLESIPFAPIDNQSHFVNPGGSYVFDVVLRTLTLGHHFTEGTSDSNQVWVDIKIRNNGELIATSGSLSPENEVHPQSHFVNAYVLDRDGNRIAERNAEDIFTKLYDHQIAPGSASVVHYQLDLPTSVSGTLEIEATLKYRKFDTHFLRAFQNDPKLINDLPIVEIANDIVEVRIAGSTSDTSLEESDSIASESRKVAKEWVRWNDYGIGWLNKPNKSALRQAESAFKIVSDFGRGEGHLNLARTYLLEGRLDEAIVQLQLADQLGAYPWSVAWFGGLIDLQTGQLDAAITKFQAIIGTQFEEARDRGFDFSLDYRVRNTLARTYFERSKTSNDSIEESKWLELAISEYQATLAIDPENSTAHYGLASIYSIQGNIESEKVHRQAHDSYRIDDNAKDRAIATARQNDTYANHAADDVVIYPLFMVDPNSLR